MLLSISPTAQPVVTLPGPLTPQQAPQLTYQRVTSDASSASSRSTSSSCQQKPKIPQSYIDVTSVSCIVKAYDNLPLTDILRSSNFDIARRNINGPHSILASRNALYTANFLSIGASATGVTSIILYASKMSIAAIVGISFGSAMCLGIPIAIHHFRNKYLQSFDSKSFETLLSTVLESKTDAEKCLDQLELFRDSNQNNGEPLLPLNAQILIVFLFYKNSVGCPHLIKVAEEWSIKIVSHPTVTLEQQQAMLDLITSIPKPNPKVRTQIEDIMANWVLDDDAEVIEEV